jgi:hypothetical protein
MAAAAVGVRMKLKLSVVGTVGAPIRAASSSSSRWWVVQQGVATGGRQRRGLMMRGRRL